MADRVKLNLFAEGVVNSDVSFESSFSKSLRSDFKGYYIFLKIEEKNFAESPFLSYCT